jgi:hypothetical protein
VLADGPNPHPNSIFPITRIIGFPALDGFWAVPPMRYFADLQNLAGRMLTQVFENAVRLNNGIWFIDEASGMSADDFAGLPGEVKVIESQGRMPELKLPKEFPQHFLKYPEMLLQLQRSLAGFSDARQGNPGSGNVGADLFDASVFQSQGITRMRAQLLAPSIQRISEQVFYMMVRFVKGAQFPDFSGKEMEVRTWEHIDKPGDYNLWLDPGSIRPLSSMAMRKLALQLKQAGLLSARGTLEAIDWPDAAGEALTIEQEQALQALARTRRIR